MEKLDTADRALSTLESILREPFSEIVRDATIQRFEYSFRSAFQVGLLDEAQAGQALLMSDQRNLTSHTYIESVAQLVYEQTTGFARLMRALLEAMSAASEDPPQSS